MIVGESVRFSLNRLVDLRLGHVTHVVKAGDRYFTGGLAMRMGRALEVPVSPVLLQEGVAVAGGGERRVNRVQVYGVAPSVDTLLGQPGTFSSLEGDTVLISGNLSSRLGISEGEEFLLRVEKASRIPLNAPFVSEAGGTVSLRVVAREVVTRENGGGFNLGISQIAPFNIFISLDRLQEAMDFEDGINVILLEGSGLEVEDIMQRLDDQFSLEDAGLNMRILDDLQVVEITSDRVFIDPPLADALDKTNARDQTNVPDPGGAVDGRVEGEGVVTYFVNRFMSATDTTPYSFVSTLPDHWLRPDEIIINHWLAEDLSVEAGDSLSLSYFEVGPLRELTERTLSFRIRAIVPLDGRFGDRSLMPAIPGLSDAGNCRDWNTAVPISLERIRDKDESYWDLYGGTPKAFISRSRGVELWQNRFGVYTSYRFPLISTDPGELEAGLINRIRPGTLGFTAEAVRDQGTTAAGGGVDFSQLFGGLSFFLLAGGIILTVLLLLLNLQSRAGQLHAMVVMGLPEQLIRRVMLWEGVVVALAGSLLGVGLSLIYNRLVFKALNGVWSDAVRTGTMEIHWETKTLAAGFAATLAIALIALWIPLRRYLKRYATAHLKRKQPEHVSGGMDQRGPSSRSGRRAMAYATLISGLAGIILIASQVVQGEIVNATIFFSAGGLLLLSLLFLFIWRITGSREGKDQEFHLRGLSWKNANRHRVRSISVVTLLSIGAFLVISTGSNRKDLFVNSEAPDSGTGGFLYFAESTLPVLGQLNDPEVKNKYGLSEVTSFVQLRRAEGDDASCLNLNKIVQPRILGVDPETLSGRFTFVTGTGLLDRQNPWHSLEQELPGGIIPAIADETVIKWSLGMQVGDTLRYTNSEGKIMELLLIGGLAPSVFQGHVIIDSHRFLEQFPESSGTHVCLVEGPLSDTAVIRSETERGFRDLGWDMELAAARLAEFSSVTNTYLSIFMVMGALGLLVGIFGVAVVLLRSVMERKQEIALLRAVGYGRRAIRKLVVREYMILLVYGIGAGFLSAVIATLPSLVSSHTGASMQAVLFWLMVLLANGYLWIHLITRIALRNRTLYTALRNE